MPGADHRLAASSDLDVAEHAFGPASLPAGAGIRAFPAQHPEKIH
jgi:hypothetical protein